MNTLKNALFNTTIIIAFLLCSWSQAAAQEVAALKPITTPASQIEHGLKAWLSNTQHFVIARTTLPEKEQEPIIKEFLQNFDGVTEAWQIVGKSDEAASSKFEMPDYLVVRQKAPKGEIRIKIIASGVYNATNAQSGAENVGVWIVQIMTVQANKDGHIFFAQHTEQRRTLVGRQMGDTTEKSLQSINPAFEHLDLVEKALKIERLSKLDPNKNFVEEDINPKR